jgi:mannose-6-phosphate isomerase-like protein (cupin superfamily)
MAEQLWFFDTLVTVHIAGAAGGDGLSVLEHQAGPGDSPPLHIHHTEDEGFCLLSGEMRIQMRDVETRLSAGSMILAPKGVPHTYRVESSNGARWLTITTRGDFEGFVRAVARPAELEELPPLGSVPTPEMEAEVAAIARQFGIEFVGPPLTGPMAA